MDIRIEALPAEILLPGLQTLLYFDVKTFKGKPHSVTKGIDGYIPSVPAFVYIYMLWLPLILLSPLAPSRTGSMTYACYQTAILLNIALSFVCYLVYPTSFARPKALDAVSSGVMKFVLRGSYKSLNCAPSIYYSICYLVLYLVDTTPGPSSTVAAIAAPVALGIMVSTLSTEQYVMVDIPVALPLTVVYILVGNRLPFTALPHWVLGT